MENGYFLSEPKLQRRIEKAERKISSLESRLQHSKQRETTYYDEVLVNHKRSAKIKQDLRLANRKNSNLLVLIQEAEKQNKTLKKDYLETCKRLCVSEARNSCMKTREKLLEKQVGTMNQSLEEVEQEYKSAMQKVEELKHAEDVAQKRMRDVMEEVYKLQTKNAELEETLTLMKRKCFCGAKGNEICSEELMECDREIAQSNDTQLLILKREKDELLERVRVAERDTLESERRNSKLKQEVVDLTHKMTEQDQQITQFNQFFETTRRNYQDEISKLESSSSKWQSKYKQCLIDLEKKAMENENQARQTDNTCKKCCDCEQHLRDYQSDIEERDIAISCLQKINNSHEGKIRQILNEYNRNKDSFNGKLLVYDGSSPDLHHQLQLLLSFYKTRSDNASAELANWKELAVEARLCREKETSLFETQLSFISKEYYAKYENCRALFEKEKSRRLELEGQTQRLSSELEECQKQFHFCSKQLKVLREPCKSLINESNNNTTNITAVTQDLKKHGECCEPEIALQMADEVNICDSSTGQENQLQDTEIQMKLENTDCERDGQNIVEISDPIEDALDGTTANEHSKPVVASFEMEGENAATVNGSNVADSREDESDQSLSVEVQNLRLKNKELQVLCDTLMEGRNEKAAGEINSGQQSCESALKCETYYNEIQKLTQDLDGAAIRYTTLEKANSVLKAENQRLETLVQELQTRIAVLESQSKLADSKANMANVVKSSEVDEAKNDAAKDIEDALNESFAAQDLADGSPDVPQTSEVNGSIVKEEPAQSNDDTIPEEPSTITTEKAPSPHSSLPRSKLPSAASTTAKPFVKRHSQSSMTQRTRPRTGSTEIERRASVGSDVSDTHLDEEGKPKQPPVKKYSTSHLDAFKPKPFMKKQTSLSDDLHLYARQRVSSKTGSTGSASDTESTQENLQEPVQSPVESDPSTPTENQTDPSPKQPPAPLPKPRKTHAEPSPKPAFQSGFSYQDYMSGIHPTEGTETAASSEQPTEDTKAGELV